MNVTATLLTDRTEVLSEIQRPSGSFSMAFPRALSLFSRPVMSTQIKWLILLSMASLLALTIETENRPISRTVGPKFLYQLRGLTFPFSCRCEWVATALRLGRRSQVLLQLVQLV